MAHTSMVTSITTVLGVLLSSCSSSGNSRSFAIAKGAPTPVVELYENPITVNGRGGRGPGKTVVLGADWPDLKHAPGPNGETINLGDKLSAFKLKEGWRADFFKDANYKNLLFFAYGGEQTSIAQALDNQVSSIMLVQVVSQQDPALQGPVILTLYEHNKYNGATPRDAGGKVAYVRISSPDFTDLRDANGIRINLNDSVSSFKLAQGWYATFYVDANYKGAHYHATGPHNEENFHHTSIFRHNRNDRFSSVQLTPVPDPPPDQVIIPPLQQWICRGPYPSNYILVDSRFDAASPCGGGDNPYNDNSWLIERFDIKKPGDVMNACTGPIPAGWVAISYTWVPGHCGRPPDTSFKNMMQIRKL